MKKSLHVLTFSLIFGGSFLFPQQSLAAIKCWTNHQGVRECGNAVPPEYAQKKTRTVNDRGITTGVTQRAKTKKELEAERASREEAKRREAEEKKQQEEQAKHDRVLLATFLTEEDIIRSRDRKISAIDASIELTRITVDKLEEKLAREEKQTANAKGKDSEARQKDIKSLKKQIADKQRYIASKEQDKQQLIEKYDADIKRFRVLKSKGQTLK